MSLHHQVLIVDDDADTREALRAFLELHGYSAVAAVSGADGLRKLRSGLRPCLILLDLVMPEKDGFQFRAEQIGDPMLADIPVVVCSADPKAPTYGMVLDALVCLAKPIDIGKLLQVVRACC